jgi:UDP-GlcNAc:undecaprenyl-phosphate GlcNAc-1-phosphate transferase
MSWIVASAVAGPCLVSVLLTLVVRRLARRWGFVDRPGGHKGHQDAVALGGGIAITLTICGTLLAGTLAFRVLLHLGLPDWLPALLQTHAEGIASRWLDVVALVGGALVLHILGIIDDVRSLGPWPKVLAQLAVAVVLVWGFDVRAAEFLPAPVSIVLTVSWFVLIINAFNFLDNMDGLSAGVAIIVGTILATAALISDQLFVPVVALIVVGTLVGFWIFNFSPASIFMGDAGSLVVGYFLAVLTIVTTYYDPQRELTPYGVLVPVVVLAVPLYDVISVCWVRVRAGESPFRGDRRHFSHRLVQRGMSPRAAVLTIYLATAATSLAALLLPRADWVTACMIVSQCFCMVMIIAVLEQAPGRAPDDK